MPSIQPYPSYRQTDLPWLGQLPAHWDIKRAKWLFTDSVDKNHPNETLLSVTQGQGVIARTDAEMRVWNPGDDISGYKLVLPNEFVISLRSFEGGIEISYVRGIVSPAYVVLRPTHPQYNEYFRHLFKSRDFVSMLNISTSGIRQGKNITYWDFRELLLPIPSLEEQQAITAYLDRQTAKIDALIAKKQRLLDLLAEQRAALISQTVTKGLNSHVKMKNSGVAWLGQVPSHWNIKKLKSICSTTKGFAFKSEIFTDEGVPVVRASEIKDFTVLPCRIFINPDIADNFRKVKLHSGDIIISTVGSKAEVVNSAVGQVAIVPAELDGALLNQNTVRLKVTNQNDVYNVFLRFGFVTDAFRKYLDLHAHGTANQASLNLSDILGFPMPIPSLSEQKEIADYLDYQTKQLTNLAAKIETAIERLREYRAALISSAVTGKIKVNDEG